MKIKNIFISIFIILTCTNLCIAESDVWEGSHSDSMPWDAINTWGESYNPSFSGNYTLSAAATYYVLTYENNFILKICYGVTPCATCSAHGATSLQDCHAIYVRTSSSGGSYPDMNTLTTTGTSNGSFSDSINFYACCMRDNTGFTYYDYDINWYLVVSDTGLYNISGSYTDADSIVIEHKNGTVWTQQNNDSDGDYSFDILENETYRIIINDTHIEEFVANDSNMIYNYPVLSPPSSKNNTYTNHTEEFDNLFTNLDTWSFITSIFGTYEIYCGATLFWLLIIIIPYLMMWIKQGSVIIPAIFALLSGSVLFALVPVEAIAPIKILLTIGIAGIFYHIIKSK